MSQQIRVNAIRQSAIDVEALARALLEIVNDLDTADRAELAVEGAALAAEPDAGGDPDETTESAA